MKLVTISTRSHLLNCRILSWRTADSGFCVRVVVFPSDVACLHYLTAFLYIVIKVLVWHQHKVVWLVHFPRVHLGVTLLLLFSFKCVTSDYSAPKLHFKGH